MFDHLHQKSDNNAKMRSFEPIAMHLHKDIFIIANIQLSFKTFINVLRDSNSSKQLSFARIVNSITSEEYSFAWSGIHFSEQYIK